MANKKIKVYLSPSTHGVGVNKCLVDGCYEDKHTRPMCESISRHLIATGMFEVKIGNINDNIYKRMAEAEKWGANLYVPVHTNAFKDPNSRYVLFMSWRTDGKYAKLYNNILPYIDDIYDGKIYHRQATNLIEIKVPKMQVIYCEFGFHTNKEDIKYIHDPEIFGKAFAKGLCKHYGVAFTVPTPVKPTPKPQVPVTKPAAKNKITEDGIWGVGTTAALQKLLGCSTVDGIVSNQLNKCKVYLLAADTNSWKFSRIGVGGSVTIKKLQAIIGATADGYAGEGTVKALQAFLQRKGYVVGAIDGVMGTKTVLALQKYINSQL